MPKKRRRSEKKKKSHGLTEIVDKADVVALHGDTGGYQETPANSLRIQLEALPESHALFFGRGSPCIFDNAVMTCVAGIRLLFVTTGVGRLSVVVAVAVDLAVVGSHAAIHTVSRLLATNRREPSTECEAHC